MHIKNISQIHYIQIGKGKRILFLLIQTSDGKAVLTGPDQIQIIVRILNHPFVI